MDGMEELLTAEEVGEILRVSQPTLYRMRIELGGFKLTKGWRYPKACVEAYIQRKKDEARMQWKRISHMESLQESINSELDLLSSYHL